MPGPINPFPQQERIWIIKKFGELWSATLVRKAFRDEFEIKPRDLPHQKQFTMVFHKFEACGDVGDPQVKRRPSDSVPQHDVKAVEDFFLRNEEGHIRDAAKELSLSFGKIWFILRKILKWKAYRPHTTTVLYTKSLINYLSCNSKTCEYVFMKISPISPYTAF